jgi:septum formation protein
MINVILASGSSTRAAMLRDSGIEFDVQAPCIDEEMILRSLELEGAKPADITDTLAEYKARRVSASNPSALVIAADQTLVYNGKIYTKPKDMREARIHLTTLRGHGHQLLSAVVVYQNSKPVWRHLSRAQLVMRDFSDVFLDDYLKKTGKDVLSNVGCYQIESYGLNLFSHIEGDYFTILGMPLLEVLGFLRLRGVILK